ncbi:MAG: hypothetical protein ABI843_02430 [Dokdonella sp.]
MKTRNLIASLIILTILACVGSIAHADQPPDMFFVTVNGSQTVYYCYVNSVRQWPSNVPMDDGVLAGGCLDPVPLGGNAPSRGQTRQPQVVTGNVSDRYWTATLVRSTTTDTFHNCSLVSLAIEQGSTRLSLDCPPGGS